MSDETPPEVTPVQRDPITWTQARWIFGFLVLIAMFFGVGLRWAIDASNSATNASAAASATAEATRDNATATQDTLDGFRRAVVDNCTRNQENTRAFNQLITRLQRATLAAPTLTPRERDARVQFYQAAKVPIPPCPPALGPIPKTPATPEPPGPVPTKPLQVP